ncbi:MAG: hypothetical protein ACKKL4_02850 [Patescibacteria group bacterium]
MSFFAANHQERPKAGNVRIIGLFACALLLPVLAFAQQSAPPGNNTDPPINTGSASQIKAGGLSLGSLVVEGGIIFEGNLGIGTSGPASSPLEVVGSAVSIIFGQNDNPAYQAQLISGDSFYGFRDGDGASTLSILQSNGSVGIGTTTPLQKLHVDGNLALTTGQHIYFGGTSGQDLYGDGATALYFDSASANTAYFLMRNSVNAPLGYLYGDNTGNFGLLDADGNWAIQSDTDANINFRVNNDEKMRILSSGNVGIGTASPGLKFDVSNTSNQANLGVIRTDGKWATLYAGSGFSGIGFDNSGYFNISPESSRTGTTAGGGLTINNLGSVGIGTTAPSAGLKLDVAGKVGATEYCDADGANCTLAASLGGGDNLGNHTATQNLVLGNNSITGIGELQFNSGSNHSITSNAAGLIFDGGDGTPDFLIYDNQSYTNNLMLGYNGTAILSTYDTNEDLQISANGTGIVDINDSVDISGELTLSSARKINFGSQELYGDNNTHLYFDSNNVSIASFMLRNSNNAVIGSLHGTNTGMFGLLNGYGNWIIQSNLDDNINFQVSNSEKMRIDSAGQVQIATTTATSSLKLAVDGKVGATEYCDENGNYCRSLAAGWPFISSPIAHPGNGNAIVVNHNLPAAPNEVQVDIVNVAASGVFDGGYTTGERIYNVPSLSQTNDGLHQMGIVVMTDNSSQIKMRVSSLGFFMVQKDSGAPFRLDPTKWSFIVKAR